MALTTYLLGRSGLWKPSFRGLISMGLAITLFMLLVNIILLAVSSNRPESAFGGNVLYSGDCQYVSSRSTIAHLAINVLASLVLAASNAAMQCLCAPERAHVDRAHDQGSWVDVGIGSLRAFTAVGWRRQIAWGLLLITSLPLHLFYNTVLIQSSQANEYRSVLATQNFMSPSANISIDDFFDRTALLGISRSRNDLDQNFPSESNGTNAWWRDTPYDHEFLEEVRAVHAETASYTNLSLSDCVTQYSQPFVQDYSNVVLVTSIPDENSSGTLWPSDVLLSGYYTPNTTRISYSMFFQGTGSSYPSNDLPAAFRIEDGSISYPKRPNVDLTMGEKVDDTFARTSVSYCLAKKTPNYCSIETYRPFLILVIVANVIKAVTFCWILARLHACHPLITIGDAIASFLRTPDRLTEGCRAISRSYVENHRNVIESWARKNGTLHKKQSGDPWPGTRLRWINAISVGQKGTLIVVSLAWFVGGAVAINEANKTWRVSGLTFAQAWQKGFGSLYPMFSLGASNSASVGTNAVLANLPQLGASLLYIFYNQLFTVMCISAEMGRYATARKPLRVSHPRGEQISSFWLGLPYRFAIPLLLTSSLFHWSLSQTLFAAVLNTVRADGTVDPTTPINTLAYSFSGLLLLYIIGGLTILGIVLVAVIRKFPAGAPIVASNSIAIAAACHTSGPDAEECPLQYGVVATGGRNVGRVGFSEKDVMPLQKGWYYDGGEPSGSESTSETHEYKVYSSVSTEGMAQP